MRDVERLVDFGRGRQAIAGPWRRQEVWRRRRLADAPGAGVGRAVIGEIEMDMVVVEDIGARPQDGGEILAGARVRLVQEGGFLAVGCLPVVDEIDLPAVGKGEAGHVDGVAEGMLGQASARYVVDAPAAIRAKHIDGRDPLPEAGLGVGLDDRVEPRLEPGNHRAVDGERLIDGNRPLASAETFKGRVMPQMPGPSISGAETM